MIDEQIVSDNSSRSTIGDAKIKEGATIIDFSQETGIQRTTNLSSHIYQQNSSIEFPKQRYKYRRDFSNRVNFDNIRNDVEKKLLNYCFETISDASDTDFEQIERSNFFDEWKDSIDEILNTVNSFSINHRKILGALLVATRDKDVSDFSDEGINILRDTTYILKQFRVTKGDSKRVFKKLREIRCELYIPLSYDGIKEQEQNELEEMMMELIKKSK